MESENRVVVLIDMDCFYCQVEEKLKPELAGKPIAVVQYNPWKGGGIIAVNYVARALGVNRHMRGDEAKEICPDIVLPVVPSSRGKADITIYRDAGKDVARVLQKFTSLLERASIDEAYLDITAPVQERLKTLSPNMVTTSLIPNTYALGYESVAEFLSDLHNGGSEFIDFDYEHATRLLVGAVIVNEIRAAVFEETGYRCSAGIAHNKILAKLVCGMNKPNKQTVLPKHSIDILYKTLSVKKVKHLGGKFGDTVCELLNISKMAELQMFSEKHLQQLFDDKNGTWLYNIARGIDLEPVQARFNPKSIGCCKNFKGKAALLELESLRKWLKDLGDEIEDRLEKDALENNRTPKQMVVSFSTQMPDGRDTSSSRSYNFAFEEELCGELFSNKALELLMESTEGTKVKEGESNRRLKAPIKFLGISVGKFEDHAESKKTKKIKDYFGAGISKPDAQKSKEIVKQNNDDTKSSKKNYDKDYIMRKFFQITDKTKEVNLKVAEGSNSEEEKPINDVANLVEKNESDLEKQESFFAKLLSKKIDVDTRSVDSDSSQLTINTHLAKPTTPVCEVVNCGDDSNDTYYSSSTINEEINKSVALFDDDPQDIDRVTDIRKLMNSTMVRIEKELETGPDENIAHKDNISTETSKDNIKTLSFQGAEIKCSECGKIIPAGMVDTHADFHFALRLRDEERQQVRAEIREKKLSIQGNKKGKPPEGNISKNDLGASISIASFLVKLDDSIPTEICAECGKKVPIEKLTEHSDFHEAQKLSKELNKRANPHATTDVSKKSNESGKSVKRKRASTSPAKKPKMPKCKSIDSFFKIT